MKSIKCFFGIHNFDLPYYSVCLDCGKQIKPRQIPKAKEEAIVNMFHEMNILHDMANTGVTMDELLDGFNELTKL